MSELHAYALLVLVGFLPSEIWRVLGLVAARGVADESELFMWVRAVAIAVLAGVIAKIILFPPGTLASVPLVIRLIAIVCGFAAFVCADRCWRALSRARSCSCWARSLTASDHRA
jgi:carbon starvation protein CstA